MNTSHKARKRFGQNFLSDQNIINKIVQAINPKPEDTIVEIGPGQGALTLPLLERVNRLDVIELDYDLIPILQSKTEDKDLTIHQADALKFDFSQLKKSEAKLRIVGNLPYNISTPLLFHLLDYSALIQDIHVMLQKEVVDRLAARPHSPDYGRLSVMMQYSCKVVPLFNVAPGCFRPAPKVDSTVVRISPHLNLPFPCKSQKAFSTLVRQAFSQRRKTLKNNLKGLLDEQQISSINIEPTVRAETLSVEQFVRLAELLDV